MNDHCQASKTAFRSHCARPDGTLHVSCVSEALCPNFQPRAHAGLTGLTRMIIALLGLALDNKTIFYHARMARRAQHL